MTVPHCAPLCPAQCQNHLCDRAPVPRPIGGTVRAQWDGPNPTLSGRDPRGTVMSCRPGGRLYPEDRT